MNAVWIIEVCATAVEGYLGISIVESFGKMRYYGKIQSIIKLIAVCIYTAFITFLNTFNLFSWVTVTTAIAIIVCCGKFVSDVNLFKAVFSASLYIIILSLIESFLIAIIGWVNGVSLHTLVFKTGYIRSIYLILDKLIDCCLFFLFNLARRKTKSEMVPATGYLLTVFLGIFIMSIFSRTVSTEVFSSLQYIIGICGVIILICVLTLVQYFYKSKIYRQEQIDNQKLQIEAQLTAEKYEQLNQIYSLNAKTFHDFKNHLVAIDCLIDENKYQEAREYIHHISNIPPLNNDKIYTSISVADAILNEKRRRAEDEKIAFTVDASSDIAESNRVSNPDLCVILSNLLDNALEACERIPEDKMRKIDVKIHPRNDFLIIKISNTVLENPFISNARLLSTKKDPQPHGMGLHNVQASVSKYNGKLSQTYQDNAFVSTVIISYRD